MSQLLRRGLIAALAPAGIPRADIVVTDDVGERLSFRWLPPEQPALYRLAALFVGVRQVDPVTNQLEVLSKGSTLPGRILHGWRFPPAFWPETRCRSRTMCLWFTGIAPDM